MECNKDEALRAKTLAEQKLVINDFEAARRIALKAKRLFPELDNISQLVTVCDIHCAAKKKIYGAEKDLYGILQVEKVADEATIRKQYRKLAPVLHPDKNKFPGAEAAFKLVGEANMVLSDIGKRSVYDIKCRDLTRASVTKLQNHQGNQSSYTAQNKFKIVPSSPFNGINHQHPQSESNPNVRLSFWTYCPFCKVKYEYYTDFINRPLRCQHCSKLFIAHDIGAQGAGTGSRFVHEKMKTANVKSYQTQPPVSQQKDIGRREPVKVNIQKDGKLPSHLAHQKTEVGGCSRSGMEQEELLKTKVNVQKPMETGTYKDMNKKRGRRMVVESSESSSDVEATFGGVVGGSGVDSVDRRNSSRHKQQVSYQEDGADESSPQKRSRMGTKEKVFAEPCHTADVAKDVSKQKAGECADVSMPNGNNMKEGLVNEEVAAFTVGAMDKKATQEAKVKKEQFGWTSDMDDAFIQAMLTQQDKGNRPKGNFSSLAYANMVDELKTKLKLDFTKARLKNRLKTLKENFAYCHDVIRCSKLSGFSWNSMTQLIEAEEEVWEKLAEVNPDAIKWRTKPISNYDELSQLFAKDRASGVASQTAKEKNAKEKKGQSSNKEPIDIETIEGINELLATNKVTYENLVNLEEIHVDSPMPDASNSTKSKSKKRKLEEESNSDIMSTVHVVADAIKEGNLVLQETNVILGRAYQREYTGDEIYKELEPLNLEDDAISNALIFLADNPKKARFLFSCPLNMRADLLKKMM